LKACEAEQLKKIMSVFFLGHLVGLPTLQSILTKFEILSNSPQIQYKKLCKSLTDHKLRLIFEYIFEQQLSLDLEKLAQKDRSCFSRELVTFVVDESIFKQWLQSQPAESGFGKFFSGQFKASVYGWKILTLGVCVAGVMYPLYFEFVKKEEKAVEVAEKLIKKAGNWLKKMKEAGIQLPRLPLSCDSGYSHPLLAGACVEHDLIYISVPKKSHLFEIDGKKVKLSAWIEKGFIPHEKKHQKAEQDLGEKTAFVKRVRAKYLSQDKEVTLLFFRLNGSGKVSVIYSTDKNIFAKTLRRHWFERTYIEQFFKLLKHVLKIEQARTRSRADFEIKLFRFAFMAWHAQRIVSFIRKKMKGFADKGLIEVQRIPCSDHDFLDLLQKNINPKS
jgi:hypothetical protein